MKLNRRSRRFHDPWGSRRGNRFGSVMHHQYLVGQSSELASVRHGVDYVHLLENNEDRFVFSTKSIEKVR